ncbi:hypothetical protein AQUCO_00201388v1 [Aquilegia coerulea]|uniref:RRP15-like protein n=1 Tax=Aquilegia coerulea TaxID=218851 RepID=A0A2G5F7U3_AQUCA|nr:hypothetical protein AQUCO_00201388v1 [Aquilegia coerulea]PIA64054.1 hypothetical protein AQUCO_00201388v1 [Aquilegia coerulea]
MASEIQVSEPPSKRKFKSGKMKNNKKRPGNFPGTGEKKVKIDMRMKKLFRKRARDYNSDDEEGEEEEEEQQQQQHGIDAESNEPKEELDEFSEDEGEEEGDAEENGDSDDEGDAVQPGITKFSEGCRAFKMAFTKIMSKNVDPKDVLGPVLSGHKKLIAEKLAEEDSERKVKGEVKKEKHQVGEKGHVKPANFLDSHEKILIGVATKGVVKLFNAVNKAQNAQKGLNPSRFKDAKALGKRRKEAFYSELRKKRSQAADGPMKGTTSTGREGDDGPAWAPLRDSYMLTNSKLKDWDKMPEKTVGGDDLGERMVEDSSSDED